MWDLRAALDPRSPASSLCQRTLVEHTGRVFRLQFDEFQIVSSSHDDTILIWDFLNVPGDEAEAPRDTSAAAAAAAASGLPPAPIQPGPANGAPPPAPPVINGGASGGGKTAAVAAAVFGGGGSGLVEAVSHEEVPAAAAPSPPPPAPGSGSGSAGGTPPLQRK